MIGLTKQKSSLREVNFFMCSYDHEIFRLLCELGVVDADHIEPYALKVRDRDDIAAFKCTKSGVVFLDSPELHTAYSATLGRIDQTDTIVAFARA